MRFACAVLSLCALRVSPGRSRENPRAPRTDRATRNPRALRVQRRQRKEVHTRVHINNDSAPASSPAFPSTTTAPSNKSNSRSYASPRRRRHRRLLPRHSDQPIRRTQRPRLPGRPRKIRPHPRPRPGDLLEYRVVTTTSHHPLAPDFWLDHTSTAPGVVSQEIFELDLPAPARSKSKSILPSLPVRPKNRAKATPPAASIAGKTNSTTPISSVPSDGPDVALTTYQDGAPCRSDWETPGTVTRDCEIRVS